MKCDKCGFSDCGMTNPRNGPLDPQYMQSIKDEMQPAHPGEDLCTYGGNDAYLVATYLFLHSKYLSDQLWKQKGNFIATLEKYGNHLPSCPKRNKSNIRMDRDNNCNCGFEEALTGRI